MVIFNLISRIRPIGPIGLIRLIDSNLRKLELFRNRLQKLLNFCFRYFFFAENTEFLSEKRLKKVVYSEFSAWGERHHSLIIVFNQGFPTWMHHIEIPRPGIDQTVGTLSDTFVPTLLIYLIMSNIAYHFANA